VDEYLYVQTEQVEEMCKRLSPHFDAFLIPSQFTGTIEYADGVSTQPEYTEDFNWGFIEDCYPDYYSCDDVMWSNLITCYVEEGEDDPDEDDIEEILKGKPEYLTDLEWGHHRQGEVDASLFEKASQHKHS